MKQAVSDKLKMQAGPALDFARYLVEQNASSTIEKDQNPVMMDQEKSCLSIKLMTSVLSQI